MSPRSLSTLCFVSLIVLFAQVMTSRSTRKLPFPSNTICTTQYLLVHDYVPFTTASTESCYIQASLHADELCGMLVIHHLLK